MRMMLALLLVTVSGVIQSQPPATRPPQTNERDGWTATFAVEPGELAAEGRNPYLILEPGYQLVLEGGGLRLAVTVLNDTKTVDGVETRVVEERETNKDQLIEISRNFFAIRSERRNRPAAKRPRSPPGPSA